MNLLRFEFVGIPETSLLLLTLVDSPSADAESGSRHAVHVERLRAPAAAALGRVAFGLRSQVGVVVKTALGSDGVVKAAHLADVVKVQLAAALGRRRRRRRVENVAAEDDSRVVRVGRELGEVRELRLIWVVEDVSSDVDAGIRRIRIVEDVSAVRVVKDISAEIDVGIISASASPTSAHSVSAAAENVRVLK